MPKPNAPGSGDIVFHDEGSVTYYSDARGEWITTQNPSDEDLEAMTPHIRDAVKVHVADVPF